MLLHLSLISSLLLNLLFSLNVEFIFTYADEVALENIHWLQTDAL